MERAFVDWLSRQIPPHRQVDVGPGDDAAIVALAADRRLVVTSDLLTDDVDFRLQDVDPQRVGHKALAVNLSDLAAMAAEPVAAIVSVALPRQGASALARALYVGLLALAKRFDVAVAGGDTNTWDGGLVISVTAFGQTTACGPLLRSGARPGDAILATGRFGGSLLGRHLDVEPRVREALTLHEHYELHAGIDVSDGLALDLARVVQQSGCGAIVQLDAVPIHPDAYQLARSSSQPASALDHALSDGEDFELLLAVPHAEAERMVRDQPLDVPITRIGRFVESRGLWAVDPQGVQRPLPATGWQHDEG